MFSSGKILKRFIWIVLLLSALFVAVRFTVIINCIDSSTISYQNGYRLDESGAAGVYNIVAIIAVTVFAVIAFLFKPKDETVLEYDDTPTIFFSALSGFMMLSTCVLFLYRYFAVHINYSKSTTLTLVFLLLAAVVFLYTASRSKKNCAGYSVSLLIIIALIIIRIFSIFFTVNGSPNSSSNLYHIFGLSSMMMFFLYEAKFNLGKSNTRMYIFFGFSSFLLTLIYAVPDLLLSAFWLLAFRDTSAFTAADLLMAVFVITRMFSFAEQYEKAAVTVSAKKKKEPAATELYEANSNENNISEQ